MSEVPLHRVLERGGALVEAYSGVVVRATCDLWFGIWQSGVQGLGFGFGGLGGPGF